MFERLRNGWNLARESFAVLRSDKKLLIFPILSTLACILVLLSFLTPFLAIPELRAIFDNGGKAAQNPLVWVLVFAFYFVNYFVIIFFNSALVACAIARFNGGEPTLGDGLSVACRRLPQILGWALVSATVGIILKAIENAHEKAGEWIAAILGTAWNALTFFVVPVLVVEQVGPIAAVKRSFAIVRQAWGESLTANFSVGLIIFLFLILGAIPLLLGALAGGTALVVGLIVTLILWVVIGLVSAAVHVIVTAVLYQFASEHRVPEQFDQGMLRGAFVHK
jgi:hypothetical protein